MQIVSWNVNGIRAVHRNGYWEDFLSTLPADIYAFQETKAWPEQLPDDLREIPGYTSYFNHPKNRKGYAGVALYVKNELEPKNIITGTGTEEFDEEGRIIGAEFDEFTILNVYFPNGGMGPERLDYKLRFYDDFLDFVVKLKNEGKNVIVCGDFNVAHKEIDLKNPQNNQETSGFLPEEREWFSALLDAGFVDVWREKHPEQTKYTWWSMRFKARERNAGWRIDYFVVQDSLMHKITSVDIHNNIFGSDHCPISLGVSVDI